MSKLRQKNIALLSGFQFQTAKHAVANLQQPEYILVFLQQKYSSCDSIAKYSLAVQLANMIVSHW
jgi:hypothetical protein